MIRDGAKMVLELEDILEELGPLHALQRTGIAATAPVGKAASQDSWLLHLVGFEVVHLDELVQRSARPTAQVLGELSVLELAGLVTRTAGGYIRA